MKNKLLAAACIAVALTLFSISETSAQTSPVYSFECFCGWISGSGCDACGTTISRVWFDGVRIKKDGKYFKNVPKHAKITFTSANNSVRFVYQDASGMNHDFTIPRSQTGYTTNTAYWDALSCCTAGGGGTTYTGGAGINISGSVISNTGDLSATNELQTLSVVGSNLSISGGNTVALPTFTETALTATDGNTIDFTTSGASNHTLTAEIKGWSAATVGFVPSVGSGGTVVFINPVAPGYGTYSSNAAAASAGVPVGGAYIASSTHTCGCTDQLITRY